MSSRGMMVIVTDLEKVLVKAGVDQEVAQEIFDDLEGEIRNLLDKAEQELQGVAPEENSSLDGGPVMPLNGNLPTGEGPRSSLPPLSRPSTSGPMDGSSCSNMIGLLPRHLISRPDKQTGEMKDSLISGARARRANPPEAIRGLGVPRLEPGDVAAIHIIWTVKRENDLSQ